MLADALGNRLDPRPVAEINGDASHAGERGGVEL